MYSSLDRTTQNNFAKYEVQKADLKSAVSTIVASPNNSANEKMK